MKFQSPTYYLQKPHFILSALLFIATLLIFAWQLSTVQYNTLSGDDLVFFHSTFHDTSIINVVIQQYIGWSARITNFLTLGVIFTYVPAPVLPYIGLPLAIIGLVSGATLLLLALGVPLRQKAPAFFYAAAISFITVLSILLLGPAPYEDFYWIAGIVTYVMPMTFLLYLLAAIVFYLKRRSSPRLYFYGLSALGAVFVSLFNEAFTLQLFGTLLVGMLCISLARPSEQNKYLLTLASLAAGMFVGILILKVAPGTSYRSHLNQTLNPSFNHSLLYILRTAGSTTIHQAASFIHTNVLGLLATVAASVIAFRRSIHALQLPNKRLYLLGIAYCLLAPVLAIYTLTAATLYAYQPEPSIYTPITNAYFAYGAAIYLGYWIAYLIARLFSDTVPVALITVGCLSVIAVSLVSLSHLIATNSHLLQLQHDESNRVEHAIREAKERGERSVNVGSTTRYFTYCMPTPNQNDWCNQAYDVAFGVKDVRASAYHDVYGK